MSEINTGSAAPTEAAPQSAESSESQETESLDTASPDAEDAQATLSDPTASKAEKVEAKKQLKKLKIKVDGKDYVEEFDPSDDDYMTRTIQMAKMGQKRAQEKSEYEKQVNAFIAELKKNPRKVLQDPNIGVDVKKMVAELIEEEINNSQKSPEQIEYEAAQAEIKEMKAEREREKEERRQTDLSREQEKEMIRYDNLMTAALEKHADLPKSPYVIKKMADLMLIGLDNGVNLDPEDVIPLVREEMQEDLKQMFAVMPEEVIEALIGKDVFARVRKKNLAKAKAAPTLPGTAAKTGIDVGKTSKETTKEQQKISLKDYLGV